MEDEKPDYRFYTLAQLYDVRSNIDKYAYPERYQELLQELAARENGKLRHVKPELRKNDQKTQGLASRWERLGASLIDCFLAIAAAIPIVIYFGIVEQVQQGGLPLILAVKLSLIGVLLFLAMHGYFLSKYGQTIGKNLLKIKIVDLDGNKPAFATLLAKRYLPISIASLLPIIGQLIPTIDVLFIFQKDKRCLHDLIAKTQVVNIDTNNAKNQKSNSIEMSA